jgi:amino acid adenylation domain-containing protein
MLVHSFLEKNAARIPGKAAIIHAGDSISYSELHTASRKVAHYLLTSGVKRQDRILIFMDNSIESVISMYAIMMAGAIFVMPSVVIKAKKMGYILKDSGAKILITHPSKARVFAEALSATPNLEKIILCGNRSIPKGLQDQIYNRGIDAVTWHETLSDSPQTFESRNPSPLEIDLATIIYTSGTTSDPKGVMSTHSNMISAATSIIIYLENDANDIVLCALPLSFDYGLYQVIMAIIYGGTVVLEKSFTYPYRVLEMIDAHKVTGFPIVPTMLSLLFEMEDVSRFKFNTLRYITNTAAALSPIYIQRFQEIWPHVTIYSMYGLTECKRVLYVPPKDLNRKIDSVGIPMPGVEVFVVNKEGKEVDSGEVGELVVRGPNVMQGYWQSPNETAKTFIKGKYPADTRLYTGDYFKRDEEGFLYFVSRKDNLIKTKGERVSPKEIESVLCEMEGIFSAAVVGIPNKLIGQEIRANIVPSVKNITEKQVLNFCKSRLEPFMIPHHVVFMDELPTLSNGKIDKKKLIRSGNERRNLLDRRKAVHGDTNRLKKTRNRRGKINRRCGSDRRTEPAI